MTDMPERIWIAAYDADDDCPLWELISENAASPDLGDAEYIRADLCGPAAQEWQPIETAPRDGKIILLYRPSAHDWAKVAPGKWNDQAWSKRPKPYWEIFLMIGDAHTSRAWPPTHWRPLPAPPAP